MKVNHAFGLSLIHISEPTRRNERLVRQHGLQDPGRGVRREQTLRLPYQPVGIVACGLRSAGSDRLDGWMVASVLQPWVMVSSRLSNALATKNQEASSKRSTSPSISMTEQALSNSWARLGSARKRFNSLARSERRMESSRSLGARVRARRRRSVPCPQENDQG